MSGITDINQLPKRDPDAPVVRRVVCAANKMNDGTLLVGARHWDSVMHATAKAISAPAFEYKWDMDKEVQGFIDQFGVFMDREEAWVVALAAGQIRYVEGWNYKPGKQVYHLYSENLY